MLHKTPSHFVRKNMAAFLVTAVLFGHFASCLHLWLSIHHTAFILGKYLPSSKMQNKQNGTFKYQHMPTAHTQAPPPSTRVCRVYIEHAAQCTGTHAYWGNGLTPRSLPRHQKCLRRNMWPHISHNLWSKAEIFVYLCGKCRVQEGHKKNVPCFWCRGENYNIYGVCPSYSSKYSFNLWCVSAPHDIQMSLATIGVQMQCYLTKKSSRLSKWFSLGFQYLHHNCLLCSSKKNYLWVA